MEKKTILKFVPGGDQEVPVTKIEGTVSLADVRELTSDEHEIIDISDAEFGMEEEYWEQVLGYCHPCCAVIGRTGYRQVEVLNRLLEDVNAKTIILPDNIQRRHINRIIKNEQVGVALVSDNCKLFSMNGEILMNKKGAKVVYDPHEK